jgi:hypothetical protein
MRLQNTSSRPTSSNTSTGAPRQAGDVPLAPLEQDLRRTATPSAPSEARVPSERRGWFSRSKARPTSKNRPSTDLWTQGTSLRTKAVVGSCWAALILWPVLAVSVFGGAQRTAVSAPSATTATRSVAEQSAGSVAEGYVGTWLSATRSDAVSLASYIDLSGMSLAEQPFEYRNLTVAAVGDTTSAGMVQVTVAAEVKETQPAMEEKQEPVITWPQRYFAVTIAVTNGGVSPVGLPRAVASPQRTGEDVPGFGTTLTAADPLAQAIASFLQSYATGTGDITRYAAPQTVIVPITPAPYLTVKPTDFRVAGAVPEEPADGTAVVTLTDVVLISGAGQQATAQYALELTVRAGRWEVSSLDPDLPGAPGRSGSTTRPSTGNSSPSNP